MRPGPAILSIAAWTLAGCAASSGPTDSRQRIAALEAIAREGGESRVPGVFASLRCDDPLVRQRAQQTLLQLTGTTNGYDWAASSGARERAIETWVAWCRRRGLAMPAEGAPHA